MCFIFRSATLDASRENEWFDGLLDLVSRLQESRIWMGEERPANILDDEFLFPLSYRYSNYATAGGESDIESVKTVSDEKSDKSKFSKHNNITK